MARTPLFESTWAQRSAVSVSVGLVLLLVMGLAWVTTTNQWVQLPGANVGVPVMWEQIGTAGENISGKVFHINQQQPIRLVLAGSRFPQQVDPDTATSAPALTSTKPNIEIETKQGVMPPFRLIATPATSR